MTHARQANSQVELNRALVAEDEQGMMWEAPTCPPPALSARLRSGDAGVAAEAAVRAVRGMARMPNIPPAPSLF